MNDSPHQDYNVCGLQLVPCILDENSRRLSRTHSGVSDTSSSTAKRPLLLTGDSLRARSAQNEAEIQRFLLDSRRDSPPADGPGIQALLLTVADGVNKGLLPVGPWRTWDLPGRVPAADLCAAVSAFCATVYRRWPELHSDPVPLAAWAEWELNGGALHPFYDGCGRISRLFSALLLIRASVSLPLYDDTVSYFAAGNAGSQSFLEYVRACIAAGAAWGKIVQSDTSNGVSA